MNICILSELFYPYELGGAERRFMEVAMRLAKKHDITVHALRLKGQPDKEEWKGIKIIRSGIKHPLNKRILPPLLSYDPFLKAMKKDYDLIHANQGIASYIGFYRRFTHRPIVATFHDIYWNQWSTYFKHPSSWIGKFMEFSWSRLEYDQIIANSTQTKEKLETIKFKSKESPIKVINSGIDLKSIQAVKAKKSNSIVYIGRLVDYKHVDTLIKTFNQIKSKFPNLKLKIIGSGNQEQHLKSIAKNKNIEFLGYVSEKEKIKHMKSARLLINPSTVEGLGLILLEAMAAGTPVLARPLPCYKDFCTNDNSVRENITAKTLSSLLNNKSKLNKLKTNGLKTAKQFTWDETAKKVEEVYRDLSEFKKK